MDEGFRRFADQCPDSILVTDAKGIVEYVNAAFERMSGYRAAEVLGRTPALLKSDAHTPDFYRRLWRTIVAGGEFRAVFTNRRKNGRRYYEEKIIRPLAAGEGVRYVSYGRDATVRALEEEKLRHAATHDPLTDLPNRNLFLDRLDQALRQAVRRNEELTVAMLDIDDFRAANTRYGHLGGDAVLKAVGARSRACLRDSDTVARVGGDEFALVLTGAGEHEAKRALEKVVAANAKPLRFEGRALRVSVSVGACCYPRDALRQAELRKLADREMYAAKRAGGIRLSFFRRDAPLTGIKPRCGRTPSVQA